MRHATRTGRLAGMAVLGLALGVAGPVLAQGADGTGKRAVVDPGQEPATVRTGVDLSPNAKVGRTLVAVSGLSPYYSMVRRGPDGKVIRLDGAVDLLALGNNHLISAERRAALEPRVLEWMEEVDRLVIDNVDYLTMIEPLDGSPGILANIDLKDGKQSHRLGQLMTMLMSTGQLTIWLQNKGAITVQESSLNQMIVSDYLQALMTERQQGAQGDEQQKAVTSFLYFMTCRDTLEAYHRLLADAAPVADRAVASLSLTGEPLAKASDWASKAKGAEGVEARRQAVRGLLGVLSFEQQRAFMGKARELNPPTSPMAGLEAPPPSPGKM